MVCEGGDIMKLHIDIWPEFDNINEEGEQENRPINFTGWVVTNGIDDLGRFEPGKFKDALHLANEYASENDGEVHWNFAWKK